MASISTSVATIGIRGTVFDLVVSPESDSSGSSVRLSLLEGEADIVDCSGGRATLGDGDAAMIVAAKDQRDCDILRTSP